MKRIITLLILLFVLIGCASEVENPYMEYESLQEINTKANTHLVKPEVMGITNEQFFILDNNTSSYVFDLNGYEYYMRGCKNTSIDMCGVFYNGTTLFANKVDEPIAFARSNEYSVVRFILGGKQYIFGVKDKGEIDEQTFNNQFNEIYNLIIYESTNQDIINLLGEYQDINSQRATATVELYDVNMPLITVSWPSSANQEDEWYAYCKYEPGKLNYESIDHIKNTYSEDGEASMETLNDFIPGYFEIIDGNICWTGSKEENTSSCVFEKLQ